MITKETLDVLNKLGMVHEDDPHYSPPVQKGWDDMVKALEKSQNPAAMKLAKRIRTQKRLDVSKADLSTDSR